MTLERTTSSSGSPGKWYVSHENNEPNDFTISKDSNPVAMRLTSSGHLTLDQARSRLGIGTNAPATPLHVYRNDGAATVAMVEYAGAGTARLDLKTTSADWRLSNQNGPLAIREDGDKETELTLTKAGDLIIKGKITTIGSCSVGCDAVFAPTYRIESIEDHATRMWEDSHLPAVGPAGPNKPMNLSGKVGGLINELEKAHIYIERLHDRLKAKEAETADLRSEVAELQGSVSNLESLMAQQLARLAAQESRPTEASALVAAR